MITALIYFLSRAQSAFAQSASGINNPKLNPSFSDAQMVIDSVINRIPYYLGGLAFFAIVYSGALYILALGDPGKTESAKKNFSWTIIGIIAILSIYMVISLIVWVTRSSPIGS